MDHDALSLSSDIKQDETVLKRARLERNMIVTTHDETKDGGTVVHNAHLESELNGEQECKCLPSELQVR